MEKKLSWNLCRMRNDLLPVIRDVIFLFSLVFLIELEPAISEQYVFLRFPFPKNIPSKDIIDYNAPDILKEHSKKEFITVRFTNDEVKDQKVMDFVILKARELKYTNDTTRVLKIDLCYDCSYGMLLQLVSLMQADEHKRWMVYENSFYIFFLDPAPSEEELEPEPVLELELEPVEL